ncbi:MAG: hypothetical protein AAF403_00570 [Pseudomonadota bacterium]
MSEIKKLSTYLASKSGLTGPAPKIPFDPKMGDEICRHIIEGKFLSDICQKHVKIDYLNLCEWLACEFDFAKKYATAQILRCDLIADEVLRIGDDDLIEPKQKHEMIAVRKWFVDKMIPASHKAFIEAWLSDAESPNQDLGNIAHLSDQELDAQIEKTFKDLSATASSKKAKKLKDFFVAERNRQSSTST